MPQELFFLVTGWWPFAGRPCPQLDGKSFMLRDIARSQDYNVVRPNQELADRRWCHVLERPGMDRLWLDAERGCCLLAREIIEPKLKTLVQRLELGGHVEASAGIWATRWFRNIRYDFRAPSAQDQQREVVNALFVVDEIRVNDVDESLFTYQPPPGALGNLAEDTSLPSQDAGLDHLDNLAQWAQRQPYGLRPPSERPLWLIPIVVVGALILLTECFMFPTPGTFRRPGGNLAMWRSHFWRSHKAKSRKVLCLSSPRPVVQRSGNVAN
jgi:hypothetical protein